MLTEREIRLLEEMLEVFARELLEERYKPYDYSFEELVALEHKIKNYYGPDINVGSIIIKNK